MLFSYLLVSLLSQNTNVNTDPSTICPEPGIISPCICTKDCPVCPAEIECSGILNIQELREVFDKSSDWSFLNLIISNSTFQFLPADVIDTKRVRNLAMRGNIMYALFDKTPPPTNVLRELELTNLVLTGGVKWDVFPSLINLKELNISNFEIRKLDQSFVNNFPVRLEGLYMADTKTRLLGETAFVKLEDLSRLFIRRTEISDLQRSMFPQLSKLIAMHFSNNKISSLPNDIFTNMPKLTVVDFSFTNIKTMTSPVFENIMPQLRQLYLEGNDIDCGCAMKWVPQLEKLPYYLKVTCTSPSALEGLSIKQLETKHFLHCE